MTDEIDTTSNDYLKTHKDPATGMYLCCMKEGNLVQIEKQPLPSNPDHPELAGYRVVRICKVCGRNHYELLVEPIEIGLAGAPI